MKSVFCKNGGAFIKVGQHIGGLDYLLPDEYVKTMKQLHSNAPESNVNELFKTIETDLNCKVSLLKNRKLIENVRFTNKKHTKLD